LTDLTQHLSNLTKNKNSRNFFVVIVQAQLVSIGEETMSEKMRLKKKTKNIVLFKFMRTVLNAFFCRHLN
jgi:hypothetical protein